jgi:outer membrane protein assembly factor BamB
MLNETLRGGAAAPRRIHLTGALLVALLGGLFAGPLARSAHGEPAWTTYHHDPGRSGVDPDAVSPITPTFSWQSPDLGAPIWGQPLILGSRVYVATLGNEIYALDASSGKVIWKQDAGTPVPTAELLPCGGVAPLVGIVGTPVIDTTTNAIYAVADTWNTGTKKAHHVLVGYDLTTGENVLSTQVDPPGADPKRLLERPALNLVEGKIVFGFGGIGDCGVYRGAVVAAPEAGGPPNIWQYTPSAPANGGGAVWGTSGPAVDAEGHIYASTGNPNFLKGQNITTYDFSDSVVELNSSMTLIGNFEPETWLFDSNNDLDLSSSGPELLPGGLLFQAGKNQDGYLIAEATMGSAAHAVYSQKVCEGAKEDEGSFGGDAYANGTIFVPCEDGVRALRYNQTARTFTALWHGPSDAVGPPIVAGGVVWVVNGEVVNGEFLSGGGTKLYGLDPSTGATLYTETLPSPTTDHFPSPSAAAGRVFVATGSSVTAYQIGQLSTQPPTVTRLTPTKGPVTGRTSVTITGTQFTGVTAVEFGALAASSFTVVSATSITADTPANAAGTDDVTVTASGGTSAVVSKDHFKFTPIVRSVSPRSGTKAGGTNVNITGAGFALGTTATRIKFGTTTAGSVNCTTSTTCTALAPAHAVGAVNVKATVNKASSANAAGDRFTYE